MSRTTLSCRSCGCSARRAADAVDRIVSAAVRATLYRRNDARKMAMHVVGDARACAEGVGPVLVRPYSEEAVAAMRRSVSMRAVPRCHLKDEVCAHPPMSSLVGGGPLTMTSCVGLVFGCYIGCAAISASSRGLLAVGVEMTDPPHRKHDRRWHVAAAAGLLENWAAVRGGAERLVKYNSLR